MSDKCATCAKTVYLAEQVKADGKTWHSLCFKCQNCQKSLTKGQEMSKKDDGRTLCKQCYATLFGPKGYGFGSTTLTGTYEAPKQ